MRSPEVARWALSRRLKRRRLELNLSVSRITEELGLSRTRWSQIENDHYMIAPAMIPDLAGLFEFDARTTADLIELRQVAGQRSRAWWLDYSDVLSPDVIRYCGFEDGASTIRVFNSTLIDGLFQTPEYAERIISSNPQVSLYQRSQVLELRRRRQRRLTEEPRLEVQAVVYEAALLANLGDDRLLRAQLAHLVQLIDDLEDTVEILVMPLDATPCGMTGGSTVHLLDFDRPDLETVIWDEALLGQLRFEDDRLSGLISLMYEQAVERSENREVSREIIAAKVRQLDG